MSSGLLVGIVAIGWLALAVLVVSIARAAQQGDRMNDLEEPARLRPPAASGRPR